MDARARQLVRGRAADRCEYCRLHQSNSELPHHIEHIIARKHSGSDEIDNLALACHRCNLHKGPNLTGIDPVTRTLIAVFHPRRDQWADHFRFRQAYIEGITPCGRATVEVLALNDPRRVELRRELLSSGELLWN